MRALFFFSTFLMITLSSCAQQQQKLTDMNNDPIPTGLKTDTANGIL